MQTLKLALKRQSLGLQLAQPQWYQVSKMSGGLFVVRKTAVLAGLICAMVQSSNSLPRADWQDFRRMVVDLRFRNRTKSRDGPHTRDQSNKQGQVHAVRYWRQISSLR